MILIKKSTHPTNSKYFSLYPFQVTLLTNAVRKHSCCLVAENKNSKLNSALSIAILYDAQVAKIDCDPSEMVLRFCFVNFNYTLEFTLTNSYSIPLYFFIPPQKVSSQILKLL